MSFRTDGLPFLALVGALLASCSGSGGGNRDTDTDTGLDTDTSWNGGPLTDCDGVAPESGMVCVKGGTYLMGCMPYDTQCNLNEKPMVEVTLSPFWIDEKEATIEELLPFLNSLQDGYVRLPAAIGKEPVSADNTIWIGNDAAGMSPVCLNEETDEYEFSYWCNGETNCTTNEHSAAGGLGWLGAKMYCEWRGLRLPTEAEWEAAARGQTKWIYPCAWEHKACWYGAYDCCGNSSYDAACYSPSYQAPCCVPRQETITGCPSPYGVKEMYGNAAEWILDHEDPNHSWCASGCTDPAPRKGEVAILKGGSIAMKAVTTRISARYTKDDNTPINFAGVRCVGSPIDFVHADGGVVWGE